MHGKGTEGSQCNFGGNVPRCGLIQADHVEDSGEHLRGPPNAAIWSGEAKESPASQADPWQMTVQCPWGPLHTQGVGWASPSHQLPLLRVSSSPGCNWYRAAFIERFTLCQALG